MKRELAINIFGGLVSTIVGGVVVWKLQKQFESAPEVPKAPATIASRSPVSAGSASRSSSDAPIPTGTASDVKSAGQAGSARYVNAASFADRKPITPVAIRGSSDHSHDVLDALAVPLKQGVFTRAFFSDGVFERALNGEGSGIAQMKLPKDVSKIVLLQIGESRKTSIADAQGAMKIKRQIAITVVEAQSGAVIKSLKFTAEGVGFDDEFVEQSLKEDLTAKLEPIRRAL